MANPQILADNYKKILTILNNIIRNDDNSPLIDYPVLIGSRAAKWHIFSFREPNDWDLMATPLQTTLFINKVKESNATFKNIKLIYYPGGGLKLAGEYIDQYTADKKLISFDIELVSEKVDLRNMKSIFEDNSEDNMKVDNMQDDDELNFDVFEDNSKKSNAEDSEDNMKNEINRIEFERFNDVHPKMSALMILEFCHNIEDKTMLPLLANFLCIVAPLKILEALKTSQIYWPADFHKNISDLHLLRDYNKDKVSIIQPLCSPQRDELIELILETRKPGAHINLNISNDDFLENEDNLFVQKCISREDLYELVKYGDHPIYQGLRDDKSKTLIKKSLFEKLDYQTKIKCAKEEAMVIALERYLIPMISKDQENSYKLALVRICTTLTKGWFRQFAIDNYPQLSNLDRDLLSIAHNIIEKIPIKQKKPDVILHDLETQAIFESIRPYTKTISSFDKIRDYDDFYTVIKRTGINITSPINSDVSVTAIITNMHRSCYEDYLSASWTASVVILPTNDLKISSEDEDEDSDEDKDDDDSDSFDMDDVNISFKDPLKIHPYQESCSGKFSNLDTKHIFVLGIRAYWRVGMSVEEIWEPINIKVKSADFVASLLEIPDLTGDLLFKYVLDCLKPTLIDVEETPLENWVNKLKSNGTIPIEPNQHLWYYAWNYKLNRKNLNNLY
ncbi:hypothetical protein C1646_762279 [Rhizophagus diaphanus]|nr:hypothetical protein C1646_762279 [Rhizophagus diaphanus] [Rhizophagus sp. MUCL 43196]